MKIQIPSHIPRGSEKRTNAERFSELLWLLPRSCPRSVPEGGGGYVGYIRKALEKGYLERPGSAR